MSPTMLQALRLQSLTIQEMHEGWVAQCCAAEFRNCPFLCARAKHCRCELLMASHLHSALYLYQTSGMARWQWVSAGHRFPYMRPVGYYMLRLLGRLLLLFHCRRTHVWSPGEPRENGRRVPYHQAGAHCACAMRSSACLPACKL